MCFTKVPVAQRQSARLWIGRLGVRDPSGTLKGYKAKVIKDMLCAPLFFYECTEKTTREEQGGVYVGVWAQPTPPHIPVLLSQLTFFQWIQV